MLFLNPFYLFSSLHMCFFPNMWHVRKLFIFSKHAHHFHQEPLRFDRNQLFSMKWTSFPMIDKLLFSLFLSDFLWSLVIPLAFPNGFSILHIFNVNVLV